MGPLDRYFKLTERGTTVGTEVYAGCVTFLTMAYIIFVNPQIIAESGMERGALVTATCLAAALASLAMGLWANVPIAQAPGMGLNAMFTYTLCIGLQLPWTQALGVVFLSGMLNVILAWTNVRDMVVRAIPLSLKLAIAVGIGMFLALIGFQQMGVIVPNPVTLVTAGDLTAPTPLLGLGGLIFMAYLLARKVKGALLPGILGVALAGMLLGVTEPPREFVTMPPSLAPAFLKLDILTPLWNVSLWSVIISFAFVDLFDSVGTLVSVSIAGKLMDDKGNCPTMRRSLQADAVATPFAALLGTSSTTSYVESATGVESGGRTGLTAVVVAVLFLLSMFLAPIAIAVPAYATAPALVLVGFMMMAEVRFLDFSTVEEGLPLFVAMLLMPMTYSISMGLGCGFITLVLLRLLRGRAREIHPVLYFICAVFLLDIVTR